MDPGVIEIRPSCSNCGDEDFVVPDELTDESIVTCEKCGASISTWGQVKTSSLAFAQENALRIAAAKFREAFQGVEGLTYSEADE